mgnify:CR=1 FL=1
MDPCDPRFIKQILIQHCTRKSDLIIHKINRKIAEEREKKERTRTEETGSPKKHFDDFDANTSLDGAIEDEILHL